MTSSLHDEIENRLNPTAITFFSFKPYAHAMMHAKVDKTSRKYGILSKLEPNENDICTVSSVVKIHIMKSYAENLNHGYCI